MLYLLGQLVPCVLCPGWRGADIGDDAVDGSFSEDAADEVVVGGGVLL